MIREYTKKALQHARYELFDDPEPYYGEVPELPGAWATGTLWSRAGQPWPKSMTDGY